MTSRLAAKSRPKKVLLRRKPFAANAGDDRDAGRADGACRFDHDVGLFVADQSDNPASVLMGFGLPSVDARRRARA